MMTLPRILCLLMLSVLRQVDFVCADGLRLTDDRTRYDGDQTILTLNGDQVTAVERSRLLPLTDEQHRILLPLNECLPTQLPVVSSRYGDCTCGLGPVAIWATAGQVIVPHDLANRSVIFDGEPPEDCLPWESTPEPSPDWDPVEVFFDGHAAMWVDGHELDAGRLEPAVGAMLAGGKSGIVVHLPPPLAIGPEATLSALLERFETLAEQQAVDFILSW